MRTMQPNSTNGTNLKMEKLRDMEYELLKHPYYSPDLYPVDFNLFKNLKKCQTGKCFGSIDWGNVGQSV